MKVWLVYEHNYDESEVHHIFDSKEKAESYIKEIDDSEQHLLPYQKSHLVIQEWVVK
jgi:hypothetical protein